MFNHGTDNDKFGDIYALKKRQLPRDPTLLPIGYFLDLCEYVGPLYSWNYTPKKIKAGVFDWMVGPGGEGGGESSFKRLGVGDLYC